MSVQGGSAVHVTATGAIDSGPGGILHAVVINTGNTGATLTLYDGTSTSGNKIAAIAATATVSLVYDARLSTGLYASVSGTLDATVVLLPPAGGNL